MICYSGVCGDLDDPDNGCVIRTGNAPGEMAFYTCNEGYTLKGNKKCECMAIDREIAEWSWTESTFQFFLNTHSLIQVILLEIGHCKYK